MVTDSMDPATVPSDGFTMFGALVTPKSRGTFKLSSKDPHATTLQDPQILTHPDDIASLIASVKQVREVGKQAALAEGWGAVECDLSRDLLTDEQIEFWCRNNAITYHHQVGTAKMGTDSMAVVSPTSLKVHGLEGVRVVDASVMPTVTNGNTNAPSMIIGEKAAEFIIAGA
jgi:choline dehydrogenase